jgi:hypothetical protein
MSRPDPFKDVEFESPFEVTEDGRVIPAHGVYAPELFDEELSPAGTWDFITGYSGQDRYSGPIMHNSEYLGGGMARDTLGWPGTYCLVAAYWSCDDSCTDPAICEAEHPYQEGWALVRLK